MPAARADFGLSLFFILDVLDTLLPGSGLYYDTDKVLFQNAVLNVFFGTILTKGPYYHWITNPMAKWTKRGIMVICLTEPSIFFIYYYFFIFWRIAFYYDSHYLQHWYIYLNTQLTKITQLTTTG